MTRYVYESKSFDKHKDSIALPDGAIGVTVDYFGDMATVRYLKPIGE